MSQSNSTTQKIALDNAVLFPFLLSLLEQGHTATIELKGGSMRPFLEDGRDAAVLRKATDIIVGEPVLAEVARGHYVLHRIIRAVDDKVTLLGDGNISPEYCLRSDVKAQVVGFYRKGSSHIDSINGRKWRIYSFIWTRLRPLRRYLLALYRRWVLLFGAI